MSDDDTSRRTETIDAQDWTRFDAITEAERHAAALADPDARPLTEERLGHMARVPRIKIIRRALGLSVEDFAARYRIPVASIRDWEARRSKPDATARAYLMVIASASDMVRDALESVGKPKLKPPGSLHMPRPRSVGALHGICIRLASVAFRCISAAFVERTRVTRPGGADFRVCGQAIGL